MTARSLPLLLLIFSGIAFSAHTAAAQDPLPKQQSGGPAKLSIKVDGKVEDWQAIPKLYNKSNQLYYAFDNDGANLYFFAGTSDKNIAQKIAIGGITLIFTIDKKDKQPPQITFPFYGMTDSARFVDMKGKPKDTVKNATTDSFRRRINIQLDKAFKTIDLKNMDGRAEAEISIYNDMGIKAIARLDEKLNFNYELCIPLKYLAVVMAKDKVAYNIKLNGISKNGDRVEISPSGRFVLIYRNGQPAEAVPNTSDLSLLAYTTDFWGEYRPIGK